LEAGKPGGSKAMKLRGSKAMKLKDQQAMVLTKHIKSALFGLLAFQPPGACSLPPIISDLDLN